MEVFIEAVLGAVALNRHVDEERTHLEYFSNWIHVNQHKWSTISTKEYQNRVDVSEEHLLTTTGSGFNDTEMELEVTSAALPWLVLGGHVLLGFTNKVDEISGLLQYCGFRHFDNDTIQSIVEWSTYPARLEIDPVQLKALGTSFKKLQRASKKKLKTPGMRWRRLGYTKLTWEAIYKQHLSTKNLNPLLGTPGITFFALICIGPDLYTMLFIDGLTTAYPFSRQFHASSIPVLASEIALAILKMIEKYGQPAFFVLLNPLSKWIQAALELALSRHMPEPLISEFIAPTELTTNPNCTPSRVSELISSIDITLENQSCMMDMDPFPMLESPDPWKTTFVEKIQWACVDIPSTHPEVAVSDPRLKYPKLKRMSLSLPTVSIKKGTKRLLRCVPPSEKQGLLVDTSVQEDVELAKQFSELYTLSQGFMMQPGLERPTPPMDFTSRKLLLHMWECVRRKESHESHIDRHEMSSILSKCDDLFRRVGSNESLWLSEGIEIARGSNPDVIRFHTVARKPFLWWDKGQLAEGLLQGFSVNDVGVTIEEPVREKVTVHLSDDEGELKRSREDSDEEEEEEEEEVVRKRRVRIVVEEEEDDDDDDDEQELTSGFVDDVEEEDLEEDVVVDDDDKDNGAQTEALEDVEMVKWNEDDVSDEDDENYEPSENEDHAPVATQNATPVASQATQKSASPVATPPMASPVATQATQVNGTPKTSKSVIKATPEKSPSKKTIKATPVKTPSKKIIKATPEKVVKSTPEKVVKATPKKAAKGSPQKLVSEYFQTELIPKSPVKPKSESPVKTKSTHATPLSTPLSKRVIQATPEKVTKSPKKEVSKSPLKNKSPKKNKESTPKTTKSTTPSWTPPSGFRTPSAGNTSRADISTSSAFESICYTPSPRNAHKKDMRHFVYEKNHPLMKRLGKYAAMKKRKHDISSVLKDS